MADDPQAQIKDQIAGVLTELFRRANVNQDQDALRRAYDLRAHFPQDLQDRVQTAGFIQHPEPQSAPLAEPGFVHEVGSAITESTAGAFQQANEGAKRLFSGEGVDVERPFTTILNKGAQAINAPMRVVGAALAPPAALYGKLAERTFGPTPLQEQERGNPEYPLDARHVLSALAQLPIELPGAFQKGLQYSTGLSSEKSEAVTNLAMLGTSVLGKKGPLGGQRPGVPKFRGEFNPELPDQYPSPKEAAPAAPAPTPKAAATQLGFRLFSPEPGSFEWVSHKAVPGVGEIGHSQFTLVPYEMRMVSQGTGTFYLPSDNSLPTRAELWVREHSPAVVSEALGPSVQRYTGRDGSIVYFNELSGVTREQLETLDSVGRLPEIVNGSGTTPRPAQPTEMVRVTAPDGAEVRTVLTDSPEKTRSAIAAQPRGLKVDVVPVTPETVQASLTAREQSLSFGKKVRDIEAELSSPAVNHKGYWVSESDPTRSVGIAPTNYMDVVDKAATPNGFEVTLYKSNQIIQKFRFPDRSSASEAAAMWTEGLSKASGTGSALERPTEGATPRPAAQVTPEAPAAPGAPEAAPGAPTAPEAPAAKSPLPEGTLPAGTPVRWETGRGSVRSVAFGKIVSAKVEPDRGVVYTVQNKKTGAVQTVSAKAMEATAGIEGARPAGEAYELKYRRFRQQAVRSAMEKAEADYVHDIMQARVRDPEFVKQMLREPGYGTRESARLRKEFREAVEAGTVRDIGGEVNLPSEEELRARFEKMYGPAPAAGAPAPSGKIGTLAVKTTGAIGVKFDTAKSKWYDALRLVMNREFPGQIKKTATNLEIERAFTELQRQSGSLPANIEDRLERVNEFMATRFGGEEAPTEDIAPGSTGRPAVAKESVGANADRGVRTTSGAGVGVEAGKGRVSIGTQAKDLGFSPTTPVGIDALLDVKNQAATAKFLADVKAKGLSAYDTGTLDLWRKAQEQAMGRGDLRTRFVRAILERRSQAFEGLKGEAKKRALADFVMKMNPRELKNILLQEGLEPKSASDLSMMVTGRSRASAAVKKLFEEIRGKPGSTQSVGDFRLSQAEGLDPDQELPPYKAVTPEVRNSFHSLLYPLHLLDRERGTAAGTDLLFAHLEKSEHLSELRKDALRAARALRVLREEPRLRIRSELTHPETGDVGYGLYQSRGHVITLGFEGMARLAQTLVDRGMSPDAARDNVIAQTYAHEYVHAFTADYLHLVDNLFARENVTPTVETATRAEPELLAHFYNTGRLDLKPLIDLTNVYNQFIRHGVRSEYGYFGYAASHPVEFAAEVIANHRLQEYLATLPGILPKQTLWHSFRAAVGRILEFFGLKEGQSQTLLHDAFQTIEKTSGAQVRLHSLMRSLDEEGSFRTARGSAPGKGPAVPFPERAINAVTPQSIFDRLKGMGEAGRQLVHKFVEIRADADTWTRQHLDRLRLAKAALTGSEKAWLAEHMQQAIERPEEVAKKLTPAMKTYLRTWTQVNDILNTQGYAFGKRVNATEGIRGSLIPPERFHPHVLRQEILERLLSGDEELLREFERMNPGKPNPFRPGPDAAGAPGMSWTSFYKKVDPFTELERYYQYPDSWLERNGFKAHEEHVRHAAYSNAEQLHLKYRDPQSGRLRWGGQGDVGPLLDQIGQAGHNEKLAQHLVETLQHRDLFPQGRLQTIEGALTVGSKIGLSLTTGLKQPSTLSNLAAFAGLRPALRGMLGSLLHPIASRKVSLAAGAPEVMHFAETGGYALPSRLGAIGQNILRGGTLPTSLGDAVTRVVASESAPSMMRDIAQMLKSRSDPTMVRWARERMESLHLPDDVQARIAAGKATPRDTLIFRQQLIDRTQLNAQRGEMPLIVNDPRMQWVFRLKKFGIGQLHFDLQEVLKQAARGNVVPLRNRLATGLLYAEAMNGVLNGLFGPNPNRKDWKDVKNAKDVAVNLLDDAATMASFGIVYQAISRSVRALVNHDPQDKRPPAFTAAKDALDIPIVDSVDDLGQLFYDQVAPKPPTAQNPDPRLDSLLRMIRSQLPAVRQALDLYAAQVKAGAVEKAQTTGQKAKASKLARDAYNAQRANERLRLLLKR